MRSERPPTRTKPKGMARLTLPSPAHVISVVVPVRAEEPPEPEFLRRLEGAELLVAAVRDTSHATLEAFQHAGARVLVREAPRGARLKEAAGMATRDVLLFLHADTLLP